jgi:hypothetical protein
MLPKKTRRLSEEAYFEERRKVLELLAGLDQFSDLSPEAKLARYTECKDDFWAFCHYYIAHYFTSTTQAEFHDDIVKKMLALELLNAIAAPRGFSKSTIVSFAFILWCIVFEKKRFIILMMETLEKATMQTWRVLLELQYNHRIINDFGKLASDEAARGDFTTLSQPSRQYQTRLLALGTGMSMRGLINAQFRPDLFIGDDLETRELARNPKRVAKLLELVFNDYFFAMCSEGWSFIIIGTIICRGSALDEIRKRYEQLKEEQGTEPKEIHFAKFRAIETDEFGNERSTWPELHPLEKLYHQRATVGTAAFSAEKQNDPQDNEGAFKEKDIRHYDVLPPGIDLSNLLLQVDPSFSDVGDNKAMVIGPLYNLTKEIKETYHPKDAQGNELPVGEYAVALELFNRKCSIDEMIRTIYKWHKRFLPTEICIDGTYAQKVIFRREFAQFEVLDGFYKLPIKYIELNRSKQERILELQPLIENNFLLLPSRKSPDVETTVIQLTRYGETDVNDDGPDVIAGWIERLRRRKKKVKVSLI